MQRDHKLIINKGRVISTSGIINAHKPIPRKHKRTGTGVTSGKLASYNVKGVKAIIVEEGNEVACYVKLPEAESLFRYDQLKSDISKSMLSHTNTRYLNKILKYHFEKAVESAKLSQKSSKFTNDIKRTSGISFMDFYKEQNKK